MKRIARTAGTGLLEALAKLADRLADRRESRASKTLSKAARLGVMDVRRIDLERKAVEDLDQANKMRQHGRDAWRGAQQLRDS